MPKLASHYGVHIEHIVLKEMTVNSIVISDLMYSQSNSSSGVEIVLKDLSVAYHVSLESGINISQVEVDDMQVKLSRQREDESASQQVNINDYIKFIPVYAVTVDNLELHYWEDEALVARYSGSLSYLNDLRLTGQMSYRELSLNVSLVVEDNIVHASMSDIDNTHDILLIDGDYVIDNDWLVLNARGKYSLDAMSTLLNDWQSLMSVKTASGDFSFALEVDIAQNTENIMSSLVAEIDFESSLKFSSKPYSIKSANAELHAQCLVRALSIEHCYFRQPQSLSAHFETAPAIVKEYLGGQVSKYQVQLNPADVIKVYRQSSEEAKYIARGQTQIFLSDHDSRISIDAMLSEIDFEWREEIWSLVSDYRINAEAMNIKDHLTAQRAKLHVDGDIRANQKHAEVFVNDGATIALFDIEYEDIAIGRLELLQQGKSKSIYEYETNLLQVEKLISQLRFKNIHHADMQFKIDDAFLNIDNYIYRNGKQSFHAQMDVQKITAIKKDLNFIAADMSADVRLRNDDIDMQGELLLGVKKAPVKFSLQNDIVSSSGHAVFQSQPISLMSNEVIAQLVGITGFPLQLKDGSFTLDGNFAWQQGYDDVNTEVNLSALAVDGDYAQNPFENLNVNLALKESNGWILAVPTKLTIDSLNVGIPLHNISMQINEYQYGVQEQPSVKVSDFYAATLEGSIFSEAVNIDLNKSINDFSLYLSLLSLEKLVELNQTQDLLATGVINGELPMRLNDGVLEIDNGWMKADENGGVIKYSRVTDVLSGNKDLKLVAQLLADFQYHEMSAAVNLEPDGALTLKTKLYGRSPESEYDGPVNLNFNIDFNLWKFLESARLLTRIGQDITEQIASPKTEPSASQMNK